MKLWILKAREGLPENDNPWNPWYDKNFGMVVRAASRIKARELAQACGADEVYGRYIKEAKRAESVPAWLDEKYSTCEELTAVGTAEVILVDNHAA